MHISSPRQYFYFPVVRAVSSEFTGSGAIHPTWKRRYILSSVNEAMRIVIYTFESEVEE